MLVREVLSDRYRITQEQFQYNRVEIRRFGPIPFKRTGWKRLIAPAGRHKRKYTHQETNNQLSFNITLRNHFL